MNRPNPFGGRPGAGLPRAALVLVLGLAGCADGPPTEGPADDDVPMRALLRAAVRIDPAPGAVPGWGVLVDAERRLVLTAGPAVGGWDEVRVTPADPRAGAGVAGRATFRDPDRGLAVVQLDRLPDGLSPLPYGPDALQPGQVLYALGPADAPGLRRGTIRQVIQVPHLCGAGPKVIPWVVAVDADGPLGPPGSPVVDADGRLAAVVAPQEGGTAGPAWLLDPPAVRNAVLGRRGPPEPVCPPGSGPLAH